MSRLRTAFRLLGSPNRFIEVVRERLAGPGWSAFRIVVDVPRYAFDYLLSLLRLPPVFNSRSRIVFVMSAAGSPLTLATTNYIAAWMDGLRRCGADARVIGWSQTAPGAFMPSEMYGRFFAPGKGALRSVGGKWLHRADVAFVHYSSAAALEEVRSLIGGGLIVVWSLEHPQSPTQGSAESNRIAIDNVVRFADGVVVMSEETGGFWATAGFALTQIKVVGTAMQSSRLIAKVRAPGLTGLYSGNLVNPEVHALPGIARRVRDSVPGFELHMYGDATPEGRKLMSQSILSAGAEGFITLHPPLNRDALRRAQCDADVLLSFQEVWQRALVGFPSKVGEYLDSGVPTVCCDVPPLSGIAIDGVTAYVAPLGNAEDFADKVIHVLQHPAEATKVGLAGRARIREVADSKIVAADLLNWVEGLTRRTDAS